jgi:hypothetical protein
MSQQGRDTNNSDERRDSMITLRVSESERSAIEAAAREAGRSMSDHLRRSAAGGAPGPRVPELNRDAWQKLAPVVANLNQLAHQANRFGLMVDERGLDEERRRSIVELMELVRDLVGRVGDRVHALRRHLYGAKPLELAADVLDDYARAAKLGRLGVDYERLLGAADELRDLSVALEEEGGA